MPFSTDQLRARYNSFTTLAAAYTAGAGILSVLDPTQLPTAVPFSLLVTRAADGLSRPYTCTARVGGLLTVSIAEGQTDNINFQTGDLVENVVSADEHERLRGFALGHTHTSGNDGPLVAHSALTGVSTDQHHAEIHALSGPDHSGSLAHTALSVVLPDQHHAEVHAIGGADHSGQLAHTALTTIGTNTHPQIDAALATGVTNDAAAAAHIAASAGVHGAAGAVVGTTDAQTLANKTLTTPTIGDYTNAQHAHTGATSGGVVSATPTFATPAIALGTAAAAGAAGSVIRSDSTIVAFDATAPTTAAYSDAPVVGVAAVAARRDHKHGMPASGGAAYATPAVLLASAAAAGAAGTGIRSDSTIAAFDTTAPTTQAFADVAAVGSAAFAARRDHLHGMPTVALANIPTAPRAHAYSTANQSIADITQTTILFNAERYDTNGIHDLVTFTERLTCQTAGLYVISGGLAFASNATGYRQARIWHNIAGMIAIQLQPAASGTETVVGVTVQYYLNVGEYVWIAAYHNVGSAINVNADVAYSPWLAMHWVA